jgi:hypothetical protein
MPWIPLDLPEKNFYALLKKTSIGTSLTGCQLFTSELPQTA